MTTTKGTTMTTKMKTLAAVGIAALLTTATLVAQTPKRPDFTGEWEMDVERSRAANQARGGGSMGSAGGGGGGSMSAVGAGPAGGAPAVTAVKIAQTTAAITIERIAGQAWEKVVYRLDGSESVNTNGRSTLKLRSRWEGETLVSEGSSETQLSYGSGSIGGKTREVRWIEKDGAMVVETTRTITGAAIQTSNGDKPIVSRQYFKRRR